MARSTVEDRPGQLRGPPRHARPFVVAFVALLVVSAVAAWNLWPFPAWELFSHLRTDRQVSWQAVAVERAGGEHVYPLASLPRYRGFAFIMAGFAGRPAAERDADCAAWLHRADTRYHSPTRLVRIYRQEWLLSDRRGDRAAPPHRALAWVCTTSGAHEAS